MVISNDVDRSPSAFAAITEGTHIARMRALLLTERGQTGSDPHGEELLVLSGSVTLDIAASTRATATLQIAETFPTSRADLDLAPFGKTEIFIARGVDQGQNGVLWAPLGYFRITTVTQNKPSRGRGRSSLTLTLHDRMATISDSRLPFPRAWSQGTSTTEIISDLVEDIYPTAVIEYGDEITPTLTSRQVIAEEDRIAAIDTVANALGGIAYWSRRGTLFIDEPLTTDPDVDITYGSQGTLIGAPRTLTRAGLINGVVARGEATDDLPPVQALVVDADENSPTFWGGPFGKVPQFFTSPLLTTESQCVKAATTILQRKLGTQQDIQVQAIVNPAVTPGHTAVIHWPDATVTSHHVTSVTIPLDVQTSMSMTLTASDLSILSSIRLSQNQEEEENA